MGYCKEHLPTAPSGFIRLLLLGMGSLPAAPHHPAGMGRVATPELEDFGEAGSFIWQQTKASSGVTPQWGLTRALTPQLDWKPCCPRVGSGGPWSDPFEQVQG